MIDLKTYAKIKDNYCLGYFGPSHEYIVLIRILRPVIEKTFPGIKVFIGCNQESSKLVQDENILLDIEIKEKKRNFGHIYELKYDNSDSHPLEKYLEECGVKEYFVKVPMTLPTTKCVIIPNGNYPTKNLTSDQIKKIEKIVKEKGYVPQVGGDIENAGWVIGVESIGLFEAAAKGIKTSLVPTGVGANLYKKMFFNAEILEV